MITHEVEDVAPASHFQQLSRQNRRNGEPKERDRALEEPVVHATSLGMRRFHRDGHTSGSHSAFGNAHQRTNQKQRRERASQANEYREQREQHNGRHQHREPADPVGQVARKNRRDTPGHRERADETVALGVVQPKILADRRQERQQDEPIQADQTEGEAHREHCLEFVASIPAVRRLHGGPLVFGGRRLCVVFCRETAPARGGRSSARSGGPRNTGGGTDRPVRPPRGAG